MPLLCVPDWKNRQLGLYPVPVLFFKGKKIVNSIIKWFDISLIDLGGSDSRYSDLISWLYDTTKKKVRPVSKTIQVKKTITMASSV
jgi:hypothetical protein